MLTPRQGFAYARSLIAVTCGAISLELNQDLQTVELPQAAFVLLVAFGHHIIYGANSARLDLHLAVPLLLKPACKGNGLFNCFSGAQKCHRTTIARTAGSPLKTLDTRVQRRVLRCRVGLLERGVELLADALYGCHERRFRRHVDNPGFG
ncbi:hypothetical protein HG531_008811 [Fusarium graminearum]|nr:hypothetical protein HG531_008811 [Fusarium graminearum]